MNFGTILNSVTKKCVTMMVESKDTESRSLARDFVRYVEVKEPLKKQFRVYHQLNSSFIKDRDSAKLFVNETIGMLDGFQFEDILTYNHILETRFNVPKMDTTDINLAISKLIKYRTSMDKTGQAEYVEAFDKIVDHVTTIREEKDIMSELKESMKHTELKFLQPKHVVRIALKKFNDRYASKFDAEDRKIFNTLREGNQQKIDQLYSDIYTQLWKEYDAIDLSRELQDKLNQAILEVGQACTQENLLNAHDLCSELKRLREES